MIEFFAWMAALNVLAYLLSRLAGWYMDRQDLTEYDRYCARVDDDLNRLMQPPTLVGSPLDVASEFSELDLAWLAENQIGGVQ